QHAGERGQRDAGDQRGGGEDDDREDGGVGEGGEPGRGAGPDVHGGTGDGAGRRDAAEQRRGQVRQALAEQLPVGIVLLPHGHAVRDLRRQQGLQGGQRRHGDRGGEQRAQRGRVVEGQG